MFKKKDRNLVKGCRYVSVLQLISKVFEINLQTQIVSYIDKSLSSYLWGYIKSYCTQQPLISKKKKWRKIINKKGYAGSILIDLGSDTTNHKLLIAKLYVYSSSKDVLFL